MTERIERLVKRYHCSPFSWECDDLAVLEKLFAENAESTRGEPQVNRMAKYLEKVAHEFPVRIHSDELIVGTDIYEIYHLAGKYGFTSNGGHYSAAYNLPLEIGVEGILRRVEVMAPAHQTAVENQTGYAISLSALTHFILRYADLAYDLADRESNPTRKNELCAVNANCAMIARHKPETFWQALQLLYFIQIFLHIEGLGANSMSFGRIDQFLYPFYKSDLVAGLLTVEEAEELWMCFAEKVSHCDVSQNIVLGGVTKDGGDAENELTSLILRAQRQVKMRQPSLSLRVTEFTSNMVWEEALLLAATGIGMPSFFNDPVVVDSMLRTHASLEDARNYAIIGCYEANPQGNTYGQTTALTLRLHEITLAFLNENKANTFTDFPGFMQAYKEFFGNIYEKKYLPSYKNIRKEYEKSASPFMATLMGGCIESGLLAEQYGAVNNWFGLCILGIGTLIDGMYAIKKIVFDEKKISLSALVNQVQENFPDDELYLSLRNMDCKFGTNTEGTNILAAELSEFISDIVVPRKLENGVQVSPALFAWMQDVHTSEVPATPDGRRTGERISYGAAPSEIASHTSPTSILASVAHLRTDFFGNGCPVTLTFPPDKLDKPEGRERIRSLIEAYYKMGGFHLQLSMQDAKTLRDAKKYPEKHKDLLIRVSGHSNYFVVLDDTLKDALIERAEMGR